MAPDVHWIDQDEVGPPVPPDDLPKWLREYLGFLRVNQLLDGSGEWLLRCRYCDLSLGLDPALARRLPIERDFAQTVLQLAVHGLFHVMDDEGAGADDDGGRPH